MSGRASIPRGGPRLRAFVRAVAFSLFAALGGAWLVAPSPPALAAQALRVRVQRPLEDDPLIDEAVTRVIGELGALGFDVEVLRRRTTVAELEQPRPLDPGTEGALLFARDGDVILVSVWASHGRHAFVQRFAAGDPASTPSVIAVSSVDALRGLLIEPSNRPREGESSRATPPSPSAAPLPDDPPDPLPSGGRADGESEPGASRRFPLDLTVRFAPALGVEALHLETVALGATASVGLDVLALGVGVERTLHTGGVREAAGSADITRDRLFGLAESKLGFGTAWQGFAAVTLGAARYAVQAEPAPGFVARDRTESRWFVGGAVGLTHWVWSNFGWFVAVDGFVLPTAIGVQMAEEEVARLGAPSGSLNLGIVGRYQAEPTE